MNQNQAKEIAAAAQLASRDIVRKQIAKGAPSSGVSKARHVAIVADVAAEMLGSFDCPGGVDETTWTRLVLRAALAGDLLNASQLRQALEKEGVLHKEQTLSNEYSVENLG
jgi:hypothetical protein